MSCLIDRTFSAAGNVGSVIEGSRSAQGRNKHLSVALLLPPIGHTPYCHQPKEERERERESLVRERWNVPNIRNTWLHLFFVCPQCCRWSLLFYLSIDFPFSSMVLLLSLSLSLSFHIATKPSPLLFWYLYADGAETCLIYRVCSTIGQQASASSPAPRLTLTRFNISSRSTLWPGETSHSSLASSFLSAPRHVYKTKLERSKKKERRI